MELTPEMCLHMQYDAFVGKSAHAWMHTYTDQSTDMGEHMPRASGDRAGLSCQTPLRSFHSGVKENGLICHRSLGEKESWFAEISLFVVAFPE